MRMTEENLLEVKEPPVDELKQQIKTILSTYYDLQKLRIATGNRIVSSFRIKLGIKPSEGDKDTDVEVKKFIDVLLSEYKNITEAIVQSEKKITVDTAIKKLNSDDDTRLTYLKSKHDYSLVSSYEYLQTSENELQKVLKSYVESHPLYEAFFKDIKGCAVAMSAVCIAYLDPYKARHVSSFFKYAGLDTVQDKDKDGELLYLAVDRISVNGADEPILKRTRKKVRAKFTYLTEHGDNYTGDLSDVKSTNEFDFDGNEIFKDKSGVFLTKHYLEKEIEGEYVQIFEDIETGEEYVGDVVRCEHGRRKGDTEMYKYINKEGKEDYKRGITYNPVLKTKLIGVLGSVLLRIKSPKYSQIYYDYKDRLCNNPYYDNIRPAAKHAMATRYMIKQFLRDLWVTWRQLEGLPVDEPYEVAKLGHKPHKYNEYQCTIAKGQVV